MISATGKRGFTLAELCVASALIGMLCLMAWPHIRRHSQHVTDDTRRDTLDLQQLAAKEQATYGTH